MAKAQWKVEEFLSEVSLGGLAKPNRFEVSIGMPVCVGGAGGIGRQVSMFCDQAYLPFTRILTTRQQLFGPPEFLPVGVDYNGDGVSLQFYVDREMNVKRFFDTWIDGVINKDYHYANYQDNYRSFIDISQLDEADGVMYKVRLIDAFPTSIQALTLDSTGANTVHKLTVVFNFRRWEEQAIEPSAEPDTNKSLPEGIIIQNGSNNPFNNGYNSALLDQNNTGGMIGGGNGQYVDDYYIVT